MLSTDICNLVCNDKYEKVINNKNIQYIMIPFDQHFMDTKY